MAKLPTVEPKGRYESQAAYDARISAIPLESVVMIRRPSTDEGLQYDADSQELTIYNHATGQGRINFGNFLGYSRVRGLDNFSGAIGFEVAKVEVARTQVPATNGFGAQVMVTRIERKISAIYASPGKLGRAVFLEMGRAPGRVSIRLAPHMAQGVIEKGGFVYVVRPKPPFSQTATTGLEATFRRPLEYRDTVQVLHADIYCTLLVDDHNKVLQALTIQ